jgi:hypothetical protein
MDAQAARYPNLVTVETFGMSTEGRPMKVMKISTAGNSTDRPSIWLDGGKDRILNRLPNFRNYLIVSCFSVKAFMLGNGFHLVRR